MRKGSSLSGAGAKKQAGEATSQFLIPVPKAAKRGQSSPGEPAAAKKSKTTAAKLVVTCEACGQKIQRGITVWLCMLVY